ncbi:zinc finger and SCAN domain-containing protein 12-like isoform X8 [Vespa velutina]|uniref:zinc finger and SCAN domain-containing protein 12-like isoform X8 n=1 Tax=Vespa velutina TaxID=202808 RepID=UPI001FB1C14C|nr:zinc finger and SCAN domain-containing protein 12-like isoform X8 [Vespa velutina]
MRTTPRSSPALVERVFASTGAAFASRAGVLHGKMSSLDYLDLCRLCLVKDRVSVPIFEGEGDVRQIFLKITACLPVKVDREDKLPKKICDDCVYKVELFYQFWNTSVNAEKQLLQWLGEVGLEEKPDYVTNVLNQNVMKPDPSGGNRLDGSMMQQVSGHQNNMGIGMMDNISLSMPMMMSTTNQQQITSVPMDASGSSVQEMPGTSTQSTHEQITQSQTNTSNQHEEEEESSEEEENSEDECDGEEGLPVKEESEEDPNNSRVIEPTTFVNVSLACDEAGPSGLQQQKVTEMPEMAMQQSTDGDPKSGILNGDGHFVYGKESIQMQPWQIVDLDGCLYYAFVPAKQEKKLIGRKKINSKNDEIKKELLEESLRISNEKDLSYTEELDTFCTMKIKKEESLVDEQVITNDQEIYEEDNKMYACEECNICFPVMQMLKRHKNAVHEQAQRYKCKICFKICRSLIAFKMHVALEHKPEQEENVDDLESLTYTCNYCNYESTNKSTLYSHISRKHSTRRTGRRKTNRGILSEQEEYACDICEFKCQTRRRLKEHLERKHASEYKYDCEFCGKKFKVKGDMRLHVRFKHKEGPIVCDVCGKTCSNSNSLYVHQKWAHFKPKYECEICKRRMVTQENLDQHILLQHERRESFVCEECGKSFSENHRLKQHMMTHTGDRPYDCHICGKAFARRTAYRQHLLIHTGKRPYICDICGKAFTQKPGLICHRKSHPGVHPPLPVVHIKHILSDFMKKD